MLQFQAEVRDVDGMIDTAVASGSAEARIGVSAGDLDRG
jgi:hypothetical protein